ncbi:hypothetical protein ABZ372_09980 [Streptomyces sp. NPDC005921]|uniref:hypothetical protein n=1 Tax=Streptomyces sp. NPDC005827 TaxID=3157070 RepID=UPI0033E206E3
MATRLLAVCGAEALRLDRSGSDESSGVFGRGSDIMLGKRWALLVLQGHQQAIGDPAVTDGLHEDRVHVSGDGSPVKRLRFPVTVEDIPLFWERPFEAAGSSSSVWCGAG